MRTDEIVEDGVKKILEFVMPSNKVMVRRIEEEKVGSLYIPQSAAARSTVGTVISVPDHGLETIDLEVGDRVIFGQNNGVTVDIRFGGQSFRYVGLHEKELVCKVTERTMEETSYSDLDIDPLKETPNA